MEFECRSTPQGTLGFAPTAKAKFLQFVRENPGMRFTMKPDLPESGRMRRYYEGAVVPLVAFYQEGMDHHDGEDRRKVREWLNQEFNGEMVNIDGKMQGVGRSTKGREHLQPFLERVLDWLNEITIRRPKRSTPKNTRTGATRYSPTAARPRTSTT